MYVCIYVMINTDVKKYIQLPTGFVTKHSVKEVLCQKKTQKDSANGTS